MKIQKTVIFAKKHLEINIKNVIKLEIIVIIKGNVKAYSKCNLKYSAPKHIPLAFHNGSN